jgi:PIN domain nuclease of toxin-antitoxin system
VSDRVRLDTHIALWLDGGDPRLSTTTRTLIEGCWQGGGTICLSAVTAWEIALLVDTGRITLDLSAEEWLDRFLGRPGLAAVPLDHRAACRAYGLDRLQHRDPVDRLLIATAIELACPFVTHDERIARFARRHGRQYGLAVPSRR